ncbi:hypothetical protein KSD_05200 [Ktedonobacter sp. SOSP1-85]|uniref:hypothetical protein n=1 Tax=Ktedonobacter sp. SOSP1-85 TaxID=2778367 RepID=UPI0019154CDB|nr:hypothetical protein [Ktedonobacter sp. SOSP1-85]GHO72749.1 hypothetical protein KSD_05200 [Ktedonobacter sp. SOSP1-85]
MLQKTVSYKALLRIVGVCFLLYGLYLIVLVLTAQISTRGSIQYDGPLIFEDPNMVWNYLLCGGWFLGNPILPGNLYLFGPFEPGPLFYVGIGILCLSVTSRRVLPVYICLQVVLWLISLSVWFPIAILMGITDYAPGVFVPFALVTLVISLALLACYKPVTRFLSKLSESNSVAPNA